MPDKRRNIKDVAVHLEKSKQVGLLFVKLGEH